MIKLKPGEATWEQLISTPADPSEYIKAQYCFNCGKAGVDRYKASVTRSSGYVTRFFCHDDERSCYEECAGHYWDDLA